MENGEVDLALIDRALRRVLLQKVELGLLDEGWSADPPILGEDDAVLDGREVRALAGELARRSVVLLRNADETLPLSPGLKLAVVGPRADTAQAMMGCYSFPMHVGVHHPETEMGVEIPTLLDALRGDHGDHNVTYAQGVPVTGGDDEGIAAAVATAADADVVVAVLGDQAGLFGRGTSGEGCDAPAWRCPAVQEELLEALLATGKPVVLVLLVGRPYELGRQIDRLCRRGLRVLPRRGGRGGAGRACCPGGPNPGAGRHAGEWRDATQTNGVLGDNPGFNENHRCEGRHRRGVLPVRPEGRAGRHAVERHPGRPIRAHATSSRRRCSWVPTEPALAGQQRLLGHARHR